MKSRTQGKQGKWKKRFRTKPIPSIESHQVEELFFLEHTKETTITLPKPNPSSGNMISISHHLCLLGICQKSSVIFMEVSHLHKCFDDLSYRKNLFSPKRCWYTLKFVSPNYISFFGVKNEFVFIAGTKKMTMYSVGDFENPILEKLTSPNNPVISFEYSENRILICNRDSQDVYVFIVGNSGFIGARINHLKTLNYSSAAMNKRNGNIFVSNYSHLFLLDDVTFSIIDSFRFEGLGKISNVKFVEGNLLFFEATEQKEKQQSGISSGNLLNPSLLPKKEEEKEVVNLYLYDLEKNEAVNYFDELYDDGFDIKRNKIITVRKFPKFLKKLFMVTSSNTSGSPYILFAEVDGVMRKLEIEGGGSMALPFSRGKDTFLNGMCVDLSYRKRNPNQFGECVDHPISPLVVVLNNEGVLQCFSFVWKKLSVDHPRFPQTPLPKISAKQSESEESDDSEDDSFQQEPTDDGSGSGDLAEFKNDVMELIHECLETTENEEHSVPAESNKKNSETPKSSTKEVLKSPRSYLETPESAIAAVTKNGMLLGQVSPRLRNNKIIVLAALENNLESMVFVGEDLKNDVDIIKFFKGESQKKASELASRRKKMAKNYDESFKMFTEISQVVEKSKGELENNSQELTKLMNLQCEFQQNLLSIQDKKLDYFSQELDKEREKTKVGLIESIDFAKITSKERVKSIAVWIDKRIGVLKNVRELALERERELDSLCTICKERKNRIVFSCGHQVCLVCGQNESLQKCPSCLKPITNRIELLSM